MGIRGLKAANMNEISPYGWHPQLGWSLSITAFALSACQARFTRPKSWRPQTVSSAPQTPPSCISCQKSTSNGHWRDEWIFCLVCPQCGLLYPLVFPMSECFTDILGVNWHKTTRGSRWNTASFSPEGRTRGEVPLRKNRVNLSQKQQRANRVLSWRGGSLPARIERLVLTCRRHTPEWKNARHEGSSEAWSHWAPIYFVPSPEYTRKAVYTQSVINTRPGASQRRYLQCLYLPDLLRKHQGDRTPIDLSYPGMKFFRIMSLESWWESHWSENWEMQQMQLIMDSCNWGRLHCCDMISNSMKSSKLELQIFADA